MFRTNIRKAAKRGPNFAGHYTVTSWGCGTGCIQAVIIDELDGTVYWPWKDKPIGFDTFHFDLNFDAGDLEGRKSFRIDSRLLRFSGCPDDAGCGTYYFEWTSNNLKLLRFIPAKRAADPLSP
jgi:hypothetical protein